MRYLRTARHTAVLPYDSCSVPSLAFAVPCKEDIAIESTFRQEQLRSGMGVGKAISEKRGPKGKPHHGIMFHTSWPYKETRTRTPTFSRVSAVVDEKV